MSGSLHFTDPEPIFPNLMAPEKLTILSLLQKAADHLAHEGFEESRLNAELLLAHVLRLRRLDLYLQFDRPLTDEETSAFRSLFLRRLHHEPVQYILGETEFMGLRILVDSRALIPRPETELLVEQALEWMRGSSLEHPRVLDIGTGSGNIPVALAHFMPEAEIVSLDISGEALAVAADNVGLHAAGNVRLVQGDIRSDVFAGEMFDVVLSNPPYIPLEEFRALAPEVRDFEPRVAMTDDGDGYSYIRRIVEFAGRHVTPGGALLMEVGHDQAGAAADCCRSAGFSEVKLFEDFGGIARVLCASRKPSSGTASAL